MRAVLAFVLALAVVVAVLSVASAHLGPSVDNLTTASSLDGTEVNTQIELGFTTSMDVRSVEHAFRIQPRVAGDFTTVGNTFVFTPRGDLRYATRYTVTVGRSAHDASGQHLFRRYHGSFTTESERLLYLGTKGSERGRIILASLSGQRTVIGPNDGSVTGFAVSPDGTLATYIRRDRRGGPPDEIWLASLSDGSTQLLLRKPTWTLSEAHISPDGQTIAFLATGVRLCRKYYGCYVDSNTPIVELLAMHSRRVSVFRSATDTPITDFIDFSPTGQLAYTDLGSALTLASVNGTHVVHVPNQGDSLQFVGFDAPGDKVGFVGQTAGSTGGDILIYYKSRYIDVSHGIYDSSSPSFATSGNAVAYAAYRSEVGIEPVYGINAYSFRSHSTAHLTDPRKQSDWEPIWSMDDRYIAFIRSTPQEAMYMGSGEIWVMRNNGTNAHALGAVGTGIQWAL